MSRKRNFKRGLTLTLALFIISSVLVLPCFAQAPESDIDYYGSSPNVIVTAYKVQPSDIYPYSVPLWQYQACGFTYSELYPNGFATGDDFAVFFENYYNEYDLTDLYDNYYNFVVQTFSYTSVTSGTLNWFVENSTLQNAINNSLFPLSDSPTFVESLENAYYNQFTYWENQLDTQYNQGVTDGYSHGYTQALDDTNAFEEGVLTIFNAPFIFISNLRGVDLFGISLFEIVGVVLVLALGFVLIRFIGGALPL